MQDVFLRTGLLHHFCRKGDRVRRRQRDFETAKAGAAATGDVIKLPRLAADVICAVTGSDMHVARPTIEHGVTGSAEIARGHIVGDGIPVKHVVRELDFNVAVQRVNLIRLLTLLSRDLDRLLRADGHFRFGGSMRCGLSASWPGTGGRRGEHDMALTTRDVLRGAGGRIRQRLACYGSRAHKQMTNQACCDNKLKSGTHAVEGCQGKVTWPAKPGLR